VFFIPTWVNNVMFLATCWLSGFQLVQLRRPNPVTNIQFAMIIFCLLMILVVALFNRVDPWLSLGFFLVAGICLVTMIRQHRMLPPMKPFE
jgi:drug/metabolite transporter (DMT)-like permease